MAVIRKSKPAAAAGGSWFSQGAEEAKKTREQLQKEYAGNNTFWIGAKEKEKTAKVIFLDKVPFNIYTHVMWVRGRKKTYTCPIKNCPLCAADLRRSFMSVYRIIDLRTFKGEKGASPPKQKFYEVGPTIQPLIEKHMKRDNLYRKIVEIERTGTAKQTNYLFDPVGEVGPKLLAKLKELKIWVPLLDPVEIYAPKDRKFLKEVAVTYGGGVEDDDGWEDEGPSKKKKPVNYLNEEDEDEDEEAEDAEEDDGEDPWDEDEEDEE